jgi:ribosome-binding protein aMBF1 (putative translation factor)
VFRDIQLSDIGLSDTARLASPLMGKRSPIEYRDALGDMLRILREEAGLRQSDVADELERPQSYVSKYERGEQRLDILELRDVLIALGTDLKEFSVRLERRLTKIGPGRRPQRL